MLNAIDNDFGTVPNIHHRVATEQAKNRHIIKKSNFQAKGTKIECGKHYYVIPYSNMTSFFRFVDKRAIYR